MAIKNYITLGIGASPGSLTPYVLFGLNTFPQESPVEQPGPILPSPSIGVVPSSYNVTHPWEACYGSPNVPVACPWPRECANLLACYYDDEPLPYRELKLIQSEDPDWIARTGRPVCYTRPDQSSSEYYLYPRPEAAAWVDGLAFSADRDPAPIHYVVGDALASPDSDWDHGLITQRTGSPLSGDVGAALDFATPGDAITLLYRVMPLPLEGPDDTSPWPDWIWKYILYGALERLYRVNGDGRIESLAKYWGQRYALGLDTLARYQTRRHRDRNVRLTTPRTAPILRRKHPRFPDGYPI
jgi:hypothetical protein